MNKLSLRLAGLLCAALLALLGYQSLTDDVTATTAKHLLADVAAPQQAINLLLGSSSIARLDANRLLPCNRWLNRGIGSATLADIERYLSLTPLSIQPRAIVMYAGENDISAGLTTQHTIEAYRRLLELLTTRYPDSELHLLAIKPSPKRRADWPRFVAVNTALRLLSDNAQALYFHQPLWPPADTASQRYFHADGIHLTATGYDLLTSDLNPPCPSH